MRAGTVAVIVAVLTAGPGMWASDDAKPAAKDDAKAAPKPAGKDTPAAERTRARLLKAKVTVDFKKVTLREALKEFAAQVETQTDRPVMWTYPADVPADTPVTYSCSGKPLDGALDEVLKLPGLGYVVVSEEDHPRDGWVRITRGAERGYAAGTPAPSPADEDDEKKAAGRLAVAKELLEKGKPADAKAVLTLVANKYPNTKAAAEAKDLLRKLDK